MENEHKMETEHNEGTPLNAQVANVATDEALREVVRAELRKGGFLSDAPVGRWAKTLSFLNSNLGIWLLSSVVIALIAFGYGKLETAYSEAANKKELIRKIDTEIAYRMKLRTLDKPIPLNKSLVAVVCNDPVSLGNEASPFFALNTGENNPFYRWETKRYVYPEFKERSIFSLIWDLEALVPQAERKELTTFRTRLEQLRDSVESGAHNETTATLDALLLKRWRSKY